MFTSPFFRAPLLFAASPSYPAYSSPFHDPFDSPLMIMRDDFDWQARRVAQRRRYQQHTPQSVFAADPFFTPQAPSQQQEQPDQEMKYEQPESIKGVSVKETPQPAKETPSTQTQNADRDPAPSPPRADSSVRHPHSAAHWLSPFGFGGADRLFDRMMRDYDWPMNDGASDSSSFACSSSSSSQLGTDGRPVVSSSTRTERRRVGDVLEERTVHTDHLGNERITTKHGLRSQLREVITDRNGSGAERKIENLRGIRPEEVEQFQQQWSQAAAKHDPKHSFLLKEDSTLAAAAPAHSTHQVLAAPAQATQKELAAPPTATAATDAKKQPTTV